MAGQKFQVVNRGHSAAAVTVQKRNFTVGLDGSLTYKSDAPYAASTWLTVQPTSFTVQPGTTQVVTITLERPATAEPGDHQVALVFLVPAGKTGANIRINRGIATPIFITVPGPIDNSVALNSLSAPHFVTGGPVAIGVRFLNTGTVHRDFRGASALRVGGAGSAEPFPDFTVPRGAVRDIKTAWNPPLMCICHPSVTIVNADGNSQSISIQVIVFPIPLLLTVLGSLMILTVLLYLFRRRYRNKVSREARRLSGASSGVGV